MKKERTLTQYHHSGNIFSPTGNVSPKLDPGVYSISVDMSGRAIIEKMEVRSDALLRLNNRKHKDLFEEIDKFWNSSEKFSKLGFTQKRGFVFHGAPGCGKSCFIKQVMEEMTTRGDVCFVAKSSGSLVEVLKQFREVEPNRPCVVILEDFDEIVNYGGEHNLLELLDGPNSVGGIFYIATTNYLSRIPERLIRKSRFDRVVEIGPPDADDRYHYFKNKLGSFETEEKIKHLAESTDGMVFSDLKDLLVAIYCLDIPMDLALAEMKEGKVKTWGGKLPELSFSSKFSEEKLSDNNDNTKSVINETVVGKILRDLDEVEGGDEKPSLLTVDNDGKPSSQGIKDALLKKLSQIGLEDVTVEDVEVDTEGNIVVEFVSGDQSIVVMFNYDEEDGTSAILVDDEDGDDSYSLMVDLSPLAPSVYNTVYGNYVNMFELGWLSKNALLTILDAGDYDVEDKPQTRDYDAFGNLLQSKGETYDHSLVPFFHSLDEAAYKVVIRGGKKTRLPILRRKRKRRLTGRQRAGIRKASRTRKTSASKRQRARSLALRKRLKIKSRKVPKGYRVGG